MHGWDDCYSVYCLVFAVVRSGSDWCVKATPPRYEAAAMAVGAADGKDAARCLEPRSQADLVERVKWLCGEAPAAS